MPNVVVAILVVVRGAVVTLADLVEDGMVAVPAVGAVAHGAGEAAMVGVGATPMPMEATVVMAAGVRIGGILTGTPIGPVGAGGGPCLMPMVA
ncbi:MAG: hypothetical protein ABF739_05570 [Acetobacter okinawensis]|uniref:hypothetical protein n=1 Tax=Acetobacter okinawensis TaxID=1076594 RepID=UPI0039ED65D2